MYLSFVVLFRMSAMTISCICDIQKNDDYDDDGCCFFLQFLLAVLFSSDRQALIVGSLTGPGLGLTSCLTWRLHGHSQKCFNC